MLLRGSSLSSIPIEMFYRPAIMPRRTEIRFGDKPDPEARALRREARAHPG